MTSKFVPDENASALSKESESVLVNHLNSFTNNDLDRLIRDYSEESLLITHDNTYRGPAEIKRFFADIMNHFPKGQSEFILDRLVAQDELVFIVWHATTPTVDVSLATDTFIIRNKKILQQTFAGQLHFVNQAA